MEAFALYLLKSCALVAMFYLGYVLLLRRETFFTSNRWYFMLGLVASAILPLVTYRKIVWIDRVPEIVPAAGKILSPLPQKALPVSGTAIDWTWLALGFYGFGLALMVLLFARDYWSLRRALRGTKVSQEADFRLLDTSEKVAPFSYFNYIVYNSSLYTDAELSHILAHEKVHSEQNHTMDVIFARLFCIVFWFNPVIWLYRKAMVQNLEFIADSLAMREAADRKSYQLTLLKITAHESCAAISNQFYQSLIKKRIVMLNRNPSKKSSAWKYLLLVPAIAAFMLCFQFKVIAQERPGPGTEVVIDKNTSDAQLMSEAQRVRDQHGVTLKFSKVKRNASGEITAIKATYKDKDGKSGTTQISGSQPIDPIRFYKHDDAIGFGGAQDKVKIIRLNKNDDDGNFAFSFNDDDDDIEAPEPPEAPEAPEAPEGGVAAPKPPKPPKTGKHVIVKTSKNGKTVVMVDGKVIDSDSGMADIGPIIVDGDDVLKGFKGKGGVYSFSSDGNDVLIDTDKITAEAMEQARKAIREAGPQMDRAKIQIEKSRAQLDRSRAQMDAQERKADAEEMRQAKAELEKARADIEKTRADMEKARAEMQAEREKQSTKK